MGNDDWRDRLRIMKERRSHDSGDALFSLWDEQKRMQAEDKKMQSELEEAKKRAKELKRTLRKHQLGEANEKLISYSSGLLDRVKSTASFGLSLLKKQKKARLYIGGIAGLVVVVGIGSIILTDGSEKGTLGDTTTKLPITEELPREKPQFTLLFPQGADAEQYDVVRISPPEADASYTYLDRFSEDGAIFRVTQQEIPDGFDIAKTATDFQATSIIQVDAVTVYHGYSERGGIQSLLFEKDNKLISIRSPQKFDDEIWASYVASLQR
jgi:hypothetical protein